ncbi:MAG: alpha/beta hydrolase [Betaproteobacteria bacterium]|nr:MAG: alpha/beta hydrolase [Betaproteobacteria bacterium]
MTKPVHVRMSDLSGFQRLANDAVIGLTDLVEAMHHTVARTPGVLGKPPIGRTTGITGLVYKSVRGVTRLVGVGLDALLSTLAPLLEDRPSSEEREAILAALNGVFGDYLVASGNPLASAMQVRRTGIPVVITRAALTAAYPQPRRKIVVLIHGLCMNDLQWTRKGHNHGAALAHDLDYAPVYLHYNTGQHISTNGREFGNLMETLLHQWPEPVERVVIIGHSMGGLVARSACHYALRAGHAWPKRLDKLIFLGTPHLGAPLERAGAWVDFLMEISPYTAPFARLGKIRSAGIKDLRQGRLRDEDWQTHRSATKRDSREPLPLPGGVRCYAIAASKQERRNSSGARIRGDGLVPVNSALGRHRDALLDLGLPETQRWVGYGMGHLDLLSNMEVYEHARDWLTDNDSKIPYRTTVE